MGIAIGGEIWLGRPNDTHILEDCLLKHIRLMGADIEADDDTITEVDIGNLAGGKWLPKACYRQNEGCASAFKLNDIGSGK